MAAKKHAAKVVDKDTASKEPPPDPRSFEAARGRFEELLVQIEGSLAKTRDVLAMAEPQATQWASLMGLPTVDPIAKTKFVEPERNHWANEAAKAKAEIAVLEKDAAGVAAILAALKARETLIIAAP